MSFTIKWTSGARKDILSLDKEVARRVLRKIESITDSPFRFLEPLRGHPYYKLRVGDYRVIFDVNRESKSLIVVVVGHRKKIYRGL